MILKLEIVYVVSNGTHVLIQALLGGGGYAEYVKVHRNLLMKIPSHLSFEEAASIPEVWLTAFQESYCYSISSFSRLYIFLGRWIFDLTTEKFSYMLELVE